MARFAPWILPLVEVAEADLDRAGSKAVRLGQLANAGFAVPRGFVIGVEAYDRFLAATGITDGISLLLHRKRFADMRWEEIWDLALRIRSLFLRAEIPGELRAPIVRAVEDAGSGPFVIRSTAPGEDAAAASFAGLHESFVNIRGNEEVLDRIRLVWASLWSDRALLYRRELGLDTNRSQMAVLVQQLIEGTSSGVTFTESPADASEMLVESVWGLNQGLVDGTVSPDRWHVDRQSGRIKRHVAAARANALVIEGGSLVLTVLDSRRRGQAPLGSDDVATVVAAARRIEQLFGAPQDVEWTLRQDELSILQARPITTGAAEGDDERTWYLSLHRSVDNLRTLRKSIEEELLPSMARAADALHEVDLVAFSEPALAAEIRRRQAILDEWVAAYWRDCIPFAHGMRLFGQVYNDRVRPDDPFEFLDLLRQDDLLGLQRNAELQSLARSIPRGATDLDEQQQQVLRVTLDRFGLASLASSEDAGAQLLRLLDALGKAGGPNADRSSVEAKRQRFLAVFSEDERGAMADLLEIARASYRLRDDDNIYLGRIEAEVKVAERVAKARLGERFSADMAHVDTRDLLRGLEDPAFVPTRSPHAESKPLMQRFEARARQLVGQPASPGVATGRARVVGGTESLLAFEEGEVLVCDAIDPNMTFVVPLAAAIVERRGGMLIHGAIIAREYGIPCVTGVPDVTEWVCTGDVVTVDGHVGLLVVSQRRGSESGSTGIT